MYKLILTAVLLSTVTMNSQTLKSDVKKVTTEVKALSSPLENQIENSKSKIDLEKEKIVKANTLLLTDAKKRVAASEEKFQKATALYETEKAKHKAILAKEKSNIKQLTADIKKYR